MTVWYYWNSPHNVEPVEGSPAGVACKPMNAGVEDLRSTRVKSTADDQPPPRQEGEAVVLPWLRQGRDGAGFGGRKQLGA